MDDYTVRELIDKVKSFCEVREWNQYHNPKDLAIGISTEANELLDIFRFQNSDDMERIMNDPEKKEHVEEELADVFFFILRFAQMNDIDLKQALEMKIGKNALKYPVDKIKGKNKKYNEI